MPGGREIPEDNLQEHGQAVFFYALLRSQQQILPDGCSTKLQAEGEEK
jgi:hypothetical protein